ncbi:hypothetical protein DPMN_090801 [Dreissena polymorpha]|uniref:Uncharacterized protein n=1 Tax=Dreissena polymorpha TaxID=45954 RepID=A0A9D4KYE7_DREPO|nr:hypothetical protein DPMN_090801 [Dreissena polymorpha]
MPQDLGGNILAQRVGPVSGYTPVGKRQSLAMRGSASSVITVSHHSKVMLCIIFNQRTSGRGTSWIQKLAEHSETNR